MEGKKLLIVGIDPGTTTGFAVLDIEGKLVLASSSKQLDLSKLISETIKLGKPVLVGTDKMNVPNLVELFATKVGARVISPIEDLKLDEKREMAKSFATSDEHQSDALAAALLAYKSSKPLLDKIDNFIAQNKKHAIRNKIKELVISKRISIKGAIDIIEKCDKDAKIIEKVVVEKKLSEDDFLRLYDKLMAYKADFTLVKSYNNRLENMIKNLEKRSNKEKEAGNQGKLADFREKRIRFLEFTLKSKEKEISELRSLSSKLSDFILNAPKFYVLKRLDTLGMNEFNYKNKTLNIQRNDILLVENPNIASESVVDAIKGRVFIIVHKRFLSPKNASSLPFIFIDAKNLKIEGFHNFGLVEKNNFELEKSKIDWVSKIVDDYKREKQSILR